MARDRANLRVDLWADDEWRELSPGAQWLYLYLLTNSTLNYVGVADWRPARIAAVSRAAKRAHVEAWGNELEAARFVVRDAETEEVSVRSFLRHDGALQNPNLWKSIGADFTAVGSRKLMRSIAHEVRRLRDEHPDGWESKKGGSMVCPWGSPHLKTLMDTPSESAVTGGLVGGLTVAPPTTTTTATATATNNSLSNAVASDDVPKSIYPNDFEQWWKTYPRREQKGDALKAWTQLKKDRRLPDGETLATASARYARTHAERQFQKLPAGWLRAHAWEDESQTAAPEKPFNPVRPDAPPGKRYAVDVASGVYR